MLRSALRRQKGARLQARVDRRYLAAAAVLGALALLLGVLAANFDTFPLDRAVSAAARDLGPRFEPVARVFNEGGIEIATGLTLSAFALLVLRADIGGALVVLLAVAVRVALTAVKPLVDRPRPSGDFELLDVVTNSSFPSGHVTTATMAVGLWLLLAGELLPRRAVTPVRIAAVAAVVLMATSRMWAGVHWWSDTYGGVIYGAAALALAFALRPSLRELSRRIARTARPPTVEGD